MAIPNPNPNIADGIKSDNKTYSSNKIESLIQTATELPIPEAGDAGKVLTVNEDADGYELDNIPAELPTPEAGDAGKVLTVNAGADGYELDSITFPKDVIIDKVTVASAFTIAQGASRSAQTSTTPIPTHTGYTASCLVGLYAYTDNGASHKVVAYGYLNNNNIMFSIYNPTSDSIDVDLFGYVVFIKD